ncbi:hypothetical protein [Nonomuraea sp. NPDC046570]|uniref:hypothetical protein n=1 Tax=Nonomuraea sp. NPDC046570 TaxID=3155255 RepID=UPI0033E3403E
MRRDLDRSGRLTHRTDWMALLSGLLFIVLGILVVTGAMTNWLVMVSVAVGGLAIAGSLAILARVVRR